MFVNILRADSFVFNFFNFIAKASVSPFQVFLESAPKESYIARASSNKYKGKIWVQRVPLH
ncbi:unnamed protein product [Meloidogyne enterolobii]|uniref:Uncharacterized protein n=1 Tax=Meloidogyne enterolobii TaxID=390850 RepID=A0ACB0Z7H3_MELEN